MTGPVTGLGARLALAVLLIAAALLGALALLWSAGTRNNEQLVQQSSQAILDNALADLRLRGEVTLEHLCEVLPNLVYFHDFKGLGEALAPVLARPDVEYLQVYDLEGRLVHDGARVQERFGEPMDDPQAGPVIAADGPLALWSNEHLDLSRPLMLGSERIGGVRIGMSRAAADRVVAREQAELTGELRARFEPQIRRLFVVFSILLAGTALGAWLVARRLLRPIRALARAAERIEAGHLEPVATGAGRRDELGVLVEAFNRMVQAMRRHDHEIRRLAYQDPLTGLPNRLMFRELLDQAVAGQESGRDAVGLLFIDLDDFKRINDTVGHDAGDEVLTEFAQRLRRSIERPGTDPDSDIPVIARLGGDEFVALISGGPVRERCATLARTILDSLNEPFDAAGHRVILGASIGVAIHPDDAHSTRHLLKCGDLAMYQAKLEGKNGVYWYRDHLAAAAEENLQLEQELREALDGGRIEVRYQPLFCVATGRMIGAEALLRWQHPEHGAIPPERFIAVAEAGALIDDLGRMALERACTDAAAWQSRCPGLRVGVNISGRQLLKRNLADQIEQVLERTGLPPECLSLELTESMLLHDRDLTSRTLSRLRARGVNVWLDDFGTGFSGLSHLRQLQVSGVKIDRSFIADILDDPDDLALSSAIIAMAHSIGMRVVAEGVEQREQLELLRERKCDMVQGFLLARPMPAGAIPDYRPDPSLWRSDDP